MSFSVVPDTNVVIARALAKHPQSPNQEFLRRWNAYGYHSLNGS